jgi:Glycosyl hydrolases family 28
VKIVVEHKATEMDGVLQTTRLQAAIDAVHQAGGGVVVVEPGRYVITTLILRSGVELHLQQGACLQAHHDLGCYPRMPPAADNKDQSPVHLLFASDAENISITGDGVIDGQDEAFWEPCVRTEDRPYGIFRFTVRGGTMGRPSPLVQFVRCRNIKLSEFTLRSPPGWGLHIFDCDQVSITGLTVRGHRYGPNTDGIGINGSRDVRVAHCDVDTGDDAIILKATNADSRCERVTVTNCVLASNCAALGLGADVCGVIRDVVFTNCVVRRSLRMIQIEMWFPGQVERATFSGITGRTLPDEGVENERPIYVDIQQYLRPEPELGRVRDLVFRDILCESRGRIMLTAQDGSCIDGVTLHTVIITVPEIEDPGQTVHRSASLQLSNFNHETRAARAAVIADNVHHLTLRNVEYLWPKESAIQMNGLCFRNVTGLIDESPRLQSTSDAVDRKMVMDMEHVEDLQSVIKGQRIVGL